MTMLTKDQALELMRKEIDCAKHIAAKLGDDRMDWRPSDNMRTTLELMRYLSYCGIAPADAILNDDWSRPKQYADNAAAMTASDFAARMDEQMTALAKMLNPLTDADLARNVELPWGEKSTAGAALVSCSVRFLCAYRMQLFLYAKASGASALDTFNCWLGMDRPADS